MKKFLKTAYIAFAVLCAAALAAAFYGSRTLPDGLRTVNGRIEFESALFSAQTPIQANGTGGALCDLKLLGVIPVKTVSVQPFERRYVALGGDLVGVKLKMRGVLVVGIESFQEKDGGAVSPAADAGLRKGDIVLSADGRELRKNEELTQAITQSEGRALTLTVERGGETLQCRLTPRQTAATGLYKGGLWVRDAAAGVGTLTFCDLRTGAIAALGHGIYDTDTASLIEASGGEIVTASVASVKKGAAGAPGEITGQLGANTLGTIEENCESGIYGALSLVEGAPETVPVATSGEVHTGAAKVICTVTDGEKQSYDVQITRVEPDAKGDRHLTLRVTDQALLSRTGGIVQGMSGSPIVQDGMLVGAVTHVFVNEPKSGYGILAERMLDVADGVRDRLLEKAG